MKSFTLSRQLCTCGLNWYLVLTLPAALLYPMYIISACIALFCATVICLFYWLILFVLQRMQLRGIISVLILFAITPLLLSLSLALFIRIESSSLHFLFQKNDTIFNQGGFLVFPAIALVAAWVVQFRHRKQLLQHLNPSII